MSVAAVVLAAGGGRRWHGDGHKLLAAFLGRPVIAWSVEHALSAGLDETVVVAGAVDLDSMVPAGVEVLANPRWAEGQASSVQLAIAHATRHSHDAVVIGLGDQPLVPAEAWRAVAAAADYPVSVATYDGKRANPVRLAAEVWPLLPTSGDEGARVLMRRRPLLVGEVPCPGQPADIDTVEDLLRWT